MILNTEIKIRLNELESKLKNIESILSDSVIKLNVLNSHYESLNAEISVKTPAFIEEINVLKIKIDSLTKLVVKQAEEIQILNAKVRDMPIHVELDNNYKEEEKKDDYNKQVEDLLAQYEN